MKKWLLISLLGVAATACDKPADAPKAQPTEAAEPADTPTVAAAGEAPKTEKKAEEAMTATIGKPAPEFELKDETGKAHKLSDYKGKVVVLEWTNPDCPYVQRHYGKDTMQTTYKALGDDKVVWLAVDSSNSVKPEDSAKWKTEQGFHYPVLQDPTGAIGKLYQAKTTPHMFVIDGEGILRYQGAIDNDPSGKEANPKNFVEEAVTAILGGKDIETSQSKPYGCGVKYGA